MIEGLKPYPKMKDSGVPWLGQVPEHWSVVRIKTLFRETDSRCGGGEGVLLSLTRARGILPHSQASNRIPSAADFSKYKTCHPGHLVMNRMQAWSGMFAVSALQGLVSPDYSVFENNCPMVITYFEHLFKTPDAVHQFGIASKGIGTGFNRLYTPDFGAIAVSAPPLNEQYTIVRFLTHADRRIRRLIRSKQKLTTLLDQQKQAIIHRAVTRGLDPHVRLKPSGVPWLGDIPEHWEVRRSKRLFAPRKELAKPGDVQLAATQAFGVIAQDDYEKLVGRRIVKIFRHLEKRRHVEIGDFVISMRSFQGGLERAWQTGCIRSSYVVLRPTEAVDVGYFSRVFKSSGYIRALQSTADFIRDGQDLNYDNFCSVDVAFPPIAEQVAISRMLDAALKRTTTLSERTSQEVLILKEFRTRLISDVVTGKLDVREAAARLPADDLAGDDPFDDSEAVADGEEDDDSVAESDAEDGDGG